MENLVEEIIQLNFNEIDNYEFPMNKLLGIVINHLGIKFEFIVHFVDSPNLLCFGSGLSSRSQKTSQGILIKPPFFRRWSWYKYFNENFIAYADPMFYLDERIQLGWYVGDKDNWYLEIISLIIKKFAKNKAIPNNNILCYGTSGGGFSSIVLGTLIRDSKVLVNNSQFNVLNYHSWAVNRLFEVLRKSFTGMSDDEIKKAINFRLDCNELFKKEKYVPSITYHVNVNSDVDIYNHCLPFLEDLLKNPYFKHDLDIHFYHDGNGHDPMSNEKSIKLIREFAEYNLYNDSSEFDGKSFQVKMPKGYYLKSRNTISNGSTSIKLSELNGGHICDYINNYIKIKKDKYNHEVNLNNFNIDGVTVWKATIVNNSEYANFWFEKDSILFHFITSTAHDEIDSVIMYLIKSMIIK